MTIRHTSERPGEGAPDRESGFHAFILTTRLPCIPVVASEGFVRNEMPAMDSARNVPTKRLDEMRAERVHMTGRGVDDLPRTQACVATHANRIPPKRTPAHGKTSVGGAVRDS
jgi:hypothetical protein